MRKMQTVLAITALVVTASAAHAGNMTFGLNGGVSSPTGDYSDGTKLGFNGGVYGDYWLKENYAFGIDINGNFLSAKDDVITSLKSPSYPDPKATSTIMSFGAHGLLALPMGSDAPIHPWLTYGAGLYHVQSKVTDAGPTLDGDESVNKFGFNGGLGADFKAGSSAKIGGDVKYHYIMDAFEVPATPTSAAEKKAANYITAGLHVTFTTNGAK